MYKITEKRLLSPNIVEMKVLAPRVAKSALPGQFIIVRAQEKSERIPLTICDADAEAGTITIVTQIIGISTNLICNMEVGDSFADFAGPLGNPSDFINEPIEEVKKENTCLLQVVLEQHLFILK